MELGIQRRIRKLFLWKIKRSNYSCERLKEESPLGRKSLQTWYLRREREWGMQAWLWIASHQNKDLTKSQPVQKEVLEQIWIIKGVPPLYQNVMAFSTFIIFIHCWGLWPWFKSWLDSKGCKRRLWAVTAVFAANYKFLLENRNEKYGYIAATWGILMPSSSSNIIYIRQPPISYLSLSFFFFFLALGLSH